jgi:hypothetical protein
MTAKTKVATMFELSNKDFRKAINENKNASDLVVDFMNRGGIAYWDEPLTDNDFCATEITSFSGYVRIIVESMVDDETQDILDEGEFNLSQYLEDGHPVWYVEGTADDSDSIWLW